ncbi:Kanadaptin [Nymphon striatum]|nr:Kanadaptin [Nymphon striatum]
MTASHTGCMVNDAMEKENAKLSLIIILKNNLLLSKLNIEMDEVSSNKIENNSVNEMTDDKNEGSSFKVPSDVKIDNLTFKVPKIDIPVLRKKTSARKVTPDNPNEISEKIVSTLNTSKSKCEDENEEISKDEEMNKDEEISKDSSENSRLALPYKQPSWSSICNEDYRFEVLKNGVISKLVELKGKPFIVFGRLPDCDEMLQHTMVSRYHAVVQFRADIPNQKNDETTSGCFLYDLGSTHGTFLNKMQVKPKVFYRIRVGHIIKFGKSTRMFVLQGPDFDQEEESEETVTELIEKGSEKKRKLDKLNSLDADGDKDNENLLTKNQNLTTNSGEETGVNWGMGEDAEEETDLSVNPYALSAPNEDTYFDDPKKTLRGYFEREGCELEYNVEEKGYSHFICKVELPIDSPSGQPVIAEASVKGKKKEAVIQCALEACRILDCNGLLRQSQHKSRKKKEKNWEENDFYDSDEDTFLDRTGTVEKKRQKRMEKANKAAVKAQTYDTLNEQLQEINQKMEEIEKNLLTSEEQEKSGEDSLEAYMNSVAAGVIHDKKAISAMKIQLSQLRLEKTKLEKFVSIAKPTCLPSLSKPQELEVKPQSKKQLPMVGSMHGSRKRYKFLSVTKKPEVKNNTSVDNNKTDVCSNAVIEHDAKDNAQVVESNASLTTKNIEKIVQKSELVKTLNAEKDLSTLSDQQIEHDKNSSPSSAKINDNKESNDINCFEEIKKREQKRKLKILKVREKMSYRYDETNPNYAMWMPPKRIGIGKGPYGKHPLYLKSMGTFEKLWAPRDLRLNVKVKVKLGRSLAGVAMEISTWWQHITVMKYQHKTGWKILPFEFKYRWPLGGSIIKSLNKCTDRVATFIEPKKPLPYIKFSEVAPFYNRSMRSKRTSYLYTNIFLHRQKEYIKFRKERLVDKSVKLSNRITMRDGTTIFFS